MTPRFYGIIPPLVTPLLDSDTLDAAGLERLIEHVIAGGVHGLFILGTSGELAGLSGKVRREVIARTVRQVKGRRPVVVGVTDTSVAESIALARQADHLIADAFRRQGAGTGDTAGRVSADGSRRSQRRAGHRPPGDARGIGRDRNRLLLP